MPTYDETYWREEEEYRLRRCEEEYKRQQEEEYERQQAEYYFAIYQQEQEEMIKYPLFFWREICRETCRETCKEKK